MEQLIRSGYLYELAGLVYYVYFLLMSRGGNAARFSQRSKVVTLLTAIVLVASVPLHYGSQPIANGIMLLLAAASIVSAFVDRRAAR